MTSGFEAFFRSATPARHKYLSRLFGLFNEEVVRYWCRCPRARCTDLGHPYLLPPGATRGYAIDFTLQDRASGRVYVAELKCELEFEGYRYLKLADARQLVHHRSPAFQWFASLARDTGSCGVRMAGRRMSVDGAMLVWGAVAAEGRRAVMREFGFVDVLSLETMLDDLREWESAEWIDYLMRLRDWSTELFQFLGSPSRA